MRLVQSKLIDKESKKKVEKVIDSIHKESGMTRKEFNEVKGIAMEMKASGKTKVLAVTPMTIVGSSKRCNFSTTLCPGPYSTLCSNCTSTTYEIKK